MRQTLSGLVVIIGLVLSACEITPREPAVLGDTQQGTVIDALEADGRFDTLVAVLRTTGLDKTLTRGAVTLFAPTDEAFARLPEGLFEMLLRHPQALTSLLEYHLSDNHGFAPRWRAQGFGLWPTREGSRVAYTLEGDTLRLNGSAALDETTIQTPRGVVYALDRVLMPLGGVFEIELASGGVTSATALAFLKGDTLTVRGRIDTPQTPFLGAELGFAALRTATAPDTRLIFPLTLNRPDGVNDADFVGSLKLSEETLTALREGHYELVIYTTHSPAVRGPLGRAGL